MKRIWLTNVRETVDFIRERFPSYVKEQIELADSACLNTFVFTDRYEMERCTEPVTFKDRIDWNRVPFRDEEWNYAFNRHTFLVHLAHAFAFTGEEKYKENFLRLFNDFAENTRLDEGTRKRCWRSLEAGIRVENYLRAFEIFNELSPLGQKAEMTLKRLLLIHKDYLLETHNEFHRLSNWGALQDHGLFLASAYFSDREGMDEALRRLDEEFELQTFRDGTHWEQSPMYQAEVLHAGLDTLLAAKRLGVKVPRRLQDNVHLMALGMMRIARPDGKCYLFGDSDEIDFRDQCAIASILFKDSELSYYAGDRDYEFYWSFPVSTEEVRKVEPKEKSHFFSESGNVIARMGRDAALRFHAGLYGSGHGHLDQLHFDLYKNGRVLLTDTGRGTYVDGKWRRDLKGAKGHNTILIDKSDMSQMLDSWGIADFAEPVMSTPVFLDKYNLVEALHFGYFDRGVVVKRRILTLEDRALVVFDDVMVNSQTEHKVDLLFHFDDTLSPVIEGKRCKAEGLEIVADERLKLSLSSYAFSRRYNEKGTSPLLTCYGKTDRNASFVTFIALDEKHVEIERMEVVKPLSGSTVPEENAVAFRLTLGKDVFEVLNVIKEYPAGGFLLKAGGIETYARIAVRKNDEETVIIRR